MIIAIVVAVLALGLAIFGFVDRKAIEHDMLDLHARVDALESAVDGKLRNAVHALKNDVMGAVRSLETRATNLEKTAVTDVKGAVNKAKAGFKTAKKRL